MRITHGLAGTHHQVDYPGARHAQPVHSVTTVRFHLNHAVLGNTHPLSPKLCVWNARWDSISNLQTAPLA